MSDLPFELIDYILTFADAPSLYELTHVSHALSHLCLKQIYQNHIQHTSLRLWMHQPGTMVHRPIAFDLDTTATTTTTIEFTYSGDSLPFDATKPISVDGCTIIFDHHTYCPGLNQQQPKKHYGLTYDDQPIVMNKSDGTSWTMEKHHQWSMYGEFDSQARYLPLRLSCNINLFNPSVLETLLQQQNKRLKERIQLKIKAMHGTTTTTSLFGGSPSKMCSTPKASSSSFNILPSSSSKHFTTSSLTSLSS